MTPHTTTTFAHPIKPKALAGFAALLLASAAQAQSNMAISGWLDIGISKKTDSSARLGTIGRSNLAFNGVEDLGGGLAATFALSTRFDLDTGALEKSDAEQPFWKGEATVGLKGGFGAIRMGRALTPLWNHAWAYDAWYNFDRVASPQWYAFAPDFLSNPQTREYGRLNNGVFYDTPKLGALSAHFSTTVGRAPTDLARSLSSVLKYEDGPLSAMVGLERNSQADKVAFVGASYRFAQLQVMGGYSHVKLNKGGAIYGPTWTNWAGASNPSGKRTGLTVSAIYTEGKSSYKVGVARDQQGATNGFNYIGSSFNNAGTRYSGPVTMTSLGYGYALSKRTTLFADLSHSKWTFTDDKGRTSAMGYAVGMSHAF